MKTIPSFTIDHIRLLRGIYVSRKDEMGSETVTTFDSSVSVSSAIHREPTTIGNNTQIFGRL